MCRRTLPAERLRAFVCTDVWNVTAAQAGLWTAAWPACLTVLIHRDSIGPQCNLTKAVHTPKLLVLLYEVNAMRAG